MLHDLALELRLFVFHLPEDWDDTVLQTEFSRYGTIVSASVMSADAGQVGCRAESLHELHLLDSM